MLIVGRALLLNPWSYFILFMVIAPIAVSPAARRTIRHLSSSLHHHFLNTSRSVPGIRTPFLAHSFRASERRITTLIALECKRLC
jgi:hypothetical protein